MQVKSICIKKYKTKQLYNLCFWLLKRCYKLKFIEINFSTSEFCKRKFSNKQTMFNDLKGSEIFKLTHTPYI